MDETLGSLLASTWRFTKEFWRPVLIGAAIFSILMGGVQWVLVDQMQDRIGMMAASLEGVEGMDELMVRVGEGDEAAYQEMIEIININLEGNAAAMMPDFVGHFAVVWGIAMVGIGLVTFLQLLYFTILAVDRTQSAGAVWRRVSGLFFPMIGVSIWGMLRSFVWIPILGFIIGIFTLPRLVFSGVILVKEDMGVFDSVRESYEATEGYWGKIVGNMLAVGFLVGIVSTMVGGLLSFVATPLAGLLVQQLASAFMLIFIVHLANTILGDQRQVVAEPAASPLPRPKPKPHRKKVASVEEVDENDE